MMRNEFDASVSRVLAFYAPPRDKDGSAQLKAYLDALYESLKALPQYEFELTCRELVGDLSPMKRPMVREFHAARSRISSQFRSSSQSSYREMTPGESAEWCLAEARNMGPIGAQDCIAHIDKLNLPMPDGVMAALLESAGKPIPSIPGSLASAAAAMCDRIDPIKRAEQKDFFSPLADLKKRASGDDS